MAIKPKDWDFLKNWLNQQDANSSYSELAWRAKDELGIDKAHGQLRKLISSLRQRPVLTVTGGIPSWVPAPTTPGDYLVLGCIHVPGHNQRMIQGIAEMIATNRHQIDGFILLGDFLDMHTLSSYNSYQSTAIPGLTLKQEYKEGNKVLDLLTFALRPNTTKHYLYGNHEDRWNRYMNDSQNAKTPLPSPREALNLDQRGFITKERWNQDFITLGNHLDLMHGQFFNVHSAKKHIDTYRGSVMYAHTHRIQTYIEGKVGGFNIGWGGDLNSPLFNYMPRGTKAQWMNGFAVVTIDEQGEYYVNQVYFHNNKFYYNGKFY